MKKSISKRIRITKTGKIMRRKMGQSHFRAKKTGNQKQGKRGVVAIKRADVKVFKKKVKGFK